MIHSGKLRHRVRLEDYVAVLDEDGNVVQDENTGQVQMRWELVANLWASIEPLSGREFIAAQSTQSEVRGRIVIRYRAGVSATMRIVHKGLQYAIFGVLSDKDSGLEYLTLPVGQGVIVEEEEVSVETIGGIAIGALGTGIYDGFILSAGDEFTSLSIASANNPAGRYFSSRAYSSAGGLRAPSTGPLNIVHDVDPTYTGWNDANRGVPVASFSDSISLVEGEGTGTVRLKAIRQSDSERPLLATANAGQIERGAVLDGAGYLWWNGPAIIEWRARLPSSGGYGHHPSIWAAFANPPATLSNTGNEYGWEGGRTENEAYLNAWTNGSFVKSSSNKTPAYRDGEFHKFTVKLSPTDFQFFVDDALMHTAPYDPDDRGNKSDRMIITNHVYAAMFEGQQYNATAWERTVLPNGVDVDVDWVRVWRASTGEHFVPIASLPDVLVNAGGALSVTLPSKLSLWGSDVVSEYVTAFQTEKEQPGVNVSNTAGFDQFPSGITYNEGTRTISGTMPSQAGALYFGVGAVGDGNTSLVARFRVCAAPVYKGASSFTWTAASTYEIDIYSLWDVGRLFRSSGNPKGLVVSGVPTGMSFSSSTGILSGTPTAASTGQLTLSATNSAGQTTTATPTFVVNASGSTAVAAPVLTGSPTLLASWDAGNAASLTLSSALIDSIAGSDGTTFALNSTGAARPSLVIHAGKNAILFNAASSQYLTSAQGALGLGSAGCTLVLIAEPVATAQGGFAFDVANQAAASAVSRSSISTAANTNGWGMRKASPTVFSDASQGVAYAAQRTLIVGTARAGTASSTVRIDGKGTASIGPNSPANDTTLDRMTLGARWVSNALTGFSNLYVFRALLYSVALTDAQQEEVAVWAATNYSTANVA